MYFYSILDNTRTVATPLLEAVRRGRDGWVQLPDRQRIRPSWVVSVASLGADGRLVAAWVVRAHGLDGTHEWDTAWQTAWQKVAALTDPADPRVAAVQTALDQCEEAWRVRHALRWVLADAALDQALRSYLSARGFGVAGAARRGS